MDPTTFKLITVIEKFSPKKIAFDQNPNPTKITKINKSFKPQNKRKKRKEKTFFTGLPATTEMFLPLYLSTNKSIVSLKALGSSNRVVMSWNMIPAILANLITNVKPKTKTRKEAEHEYKQTLYMVATKFELKKRN